MGEHVEYATLIFDSLHRTSTTSTPSPELLKLLGTIFLCVSTIVGAIKSQALPHLSTLLPTMIKVLEYANNIPMASSEDLYRGRTLLIRSLLSAMASIVTDLPSFSHPYVIQILETCLMVYSTVHQEVDIICNEVDRCLGLIISKIPVRTLVPCLEKGVGNLLALSHTAARRMCELLGELWG